MTLYLLDANVLIRAHEDYYPVDRIPQFWSWLLEMADANTVKAPPEIYDEVTPSRGPFADWLKQEQVKASLILNERADITRVQHILSREYAPDLDDIEVQQIGQDPFLVAAAFAGVDRIVVTQEVSKRSQKRAKRKIPDVCGLFGIPVITPFALYRLLNFSIR